MAFRFPTNMFGRALLISLPMIGSAAGPAPADSVKAIDRELRQLKAEVLDFNQRASSAETTFLFPDETRLTVYVGVQAPGLLIEQVTIKIDDQAPTVRKFDVYESIALQRRGLYRALRANIEPGSHRIRLEFSGRYADAKPGSPALRARHDGNFEKTVVPSDLEMRITVPAYGEPPALTLRDWRPAS